MNSSDYDGRTSLHLAASEGQLESVRLLLARGANPDPVDRWGNRPADHAARSGSTDIVAVLDAASSKSGPPSHKLSEQEGSSL